MAFPWLRVLNAVLGVGDLARLIQGRQPADSEQLAIPEAGGSLETGLAGVVVAALKEAFNRDQVARLYKGMDLKKSY